MTETLQYMDPLSMDGVMLSKKSSKISNLFLLQKIFLFLKDILHTGTNLQKCVGGRLFVLKALCVCDTCRSVYGCVVNSQEPIRHSFKVSDEKFKESVPKLSQESIQYIYNKRANSSLQRISLHQTFCQKVAVSPI